MNGDAGPEQLDTTSIRIIEAGYRSVNDPAAFDDLVAAWKSRIDAVRDGSASFLLTPALSRHCDELIILLDSVQGSLKLNEHDTFVRSALGPAAVISPSGTVIALNEAAAQRFGLAVGQQPDFSFLAHESRAILRNMLKSCDNGGNALRAILRSEEADDRLDLLDAQMVSTGPKSSKAIGLKLIGYDWSDTVHDLMMLAFDLSDAEAQVVGALYTHADLAAVAEARGTSVRTVRTQLHQVFEKTMVSGQVELVRMVSLICAQEGSRNSPLADWRDPLSREQYFYSQSGQKICWTWMGAEHGEPAMLCHGPLTGNIFLPEVAARLADAGVKLYAITRPGFGHSDPGEGKGAHVDGAIAIHALAEHLGLRGVLGIGIVNGIIPLLYASSCDRGLFRHLLCIGASVPVSQLELEALPELQSTIYRLANSSLEAFEAFARTGYRAVMTAGPAYFLSRMYEGSPVDQDVLQNQDVFALLKASTAMVVTQGFHAFYNDMMMSMIDFDDFIQESAPLTMLAGTADPVYSFASVQAFCRQKSINLVTVEGAGQTVCHSHGQETADAIVDCMELG